MELEDLKSGWQNAGHAFKTEADLLNMTKITNHPTLKGIRLKLIAETIFLLLFLVIYYDWFDGDKKPFYANVFLVVGLLLYVANDVIGFISLAKPISGVNVKRSIKNYLAKVKRLSVFSLAFSFLYSISLIIFFTSVINFTREKRFLLVALTIILFQLMFWSFRIWRKRIVRLRELVKDLDLDDNQ